MSIQSVSDLAVLSMVLYIKGRLGVWLLGTYLYFLGILNQFMNSLTAIENASHSTLPFSMGYFFSILQLPTQLLRSLLQTPSSEYIIHYSHTLFSTSHITTPEYKVNYTF